MNGNKAVCVNETRIISIISLRGLVSVNCRWQLSKIAMNRSLLDAPPSEIYYTIVYVWTVQMFVAEGAKSQ